MFSSFTLSPPGLIVGEHEEGAVPGPGESSAGAGDGGIDWSRASCCGPVGGHEAKEGHESSSDSDSFSSFTLSRPTRGGLRYIIVALASIVCPQKTHCPSRFSERICPKRPYFFQTDAGLKSAPHFAHVVSITFSALSSSMGDPILDMISSITSGRPPYDCFTHNWYPHASQCPDVISARYFVGLGLRVVVVAEKPVRQCGQCVLKVWNRGAPPLGSCSPPPPPPPPQI